MGKCATYLKNWGQNVQGLDPDIPKYGLIESFKYLFLPNVSDMKFVTEKELFAGFNSSENLGSKSQGHNVTKDGKKWHFHPQFHPVKGDDVWQVWKSKR